VFTLQNKSDCYIHHTCIYIVLAFSGADPGFSKWGGRQRAYKAVRGGTPNGVHGQNPRPPRPGAQHCLLKLKAFVHFYTKEDRKLNI